MKKGQDKVHRSLGEKHVKVIMNAAATLGTQSKYLSKLGLVKYDSPVLKSVKNRRGVCVPQPPPPDKITIPHTFSDLGINKAHCQKVKTNVDQDSLFNETEMKNLPNNLYPPLEWTEDNCIYHKYVSTDVTSLSSDTLELISELAQLSIDDPNLTSFGVSDMAQHIWTEALDECIRQIILERPVQGILLRRIRDLTLQDLESRKKLYLSSAAFGARKDIQLHTQIMDMTDRIDKNAETKEQLVQDLNDLTEELKHSEEKFSQYLDHDQQEFRAEIVPLLNDKRRLLNELKLRTEVQY